MFKIDEDTIKKVAKIMEKDAGEPVKVYRQFQNVVIYSDYNEITFYFNPNKVVIQRISVRHKRQGVSREIIKAIASTKDIKVIVLESVLTDEGNALARGLGFKPMQNYRFCYEMLIK